MFLLYFIFYILFYMFSLYFISNFWRDALLKTDYNVKTRKKGFVYKNENI